MEATCPLRLRPCPCDIQFLEVHVCAFLAQLNRVRLYTKHRILNELLPWNLNQNVFARSHQVEPFTVDVLQVRIASGRRRGRRSRRRRWRRRWRLSRRRRRVERRGRGRTGGRAARRAARRGRSRRRRRTGRRGRGRTGGRAARRTGRRGRGRTGGRAACRAARRTGRRGRGRAARRGRRGCCSRTLEHQRRSGALVEGFARPKTTAPRPHPFCNQRKRDGVLTGEFRLWNGACERLPDWAWVCLIIANLLLPARVVGPNSGAFRPRVLHREDGHLWKGTSSIVSRPQQERCILSIARNAELQERVSSAAPAVGVALVDQNLLGTIIR
mmetsp:Transcript_94907/g.250771  ORF Transcript_94907/g.250771 Transcript_94907/m.250771 type:complete len:328 (-) Transcript_94907:273-1256(-)